MGCDIHLHQEIKVNGKWEHYAVRWVNRDYELFSKMANVRNDEPGKPYWVKPISEPKGLPGSLSEVTKIFHRKWEEDAHSASWLGLEEIRELENWYYGKDTGHPDYQKGRVWEENFGWFFGNHWGDSLRYKEVAKELEEMGIEDVRWVFWFDN